MKNYVKNHWFETSITLVLAVIILNLLFISPVIGMANNGDFERVTTPFSICFFDESDWLGMYFNYIHMTFRIYSDTFFTRLAGGYVTSHFLVIGVAKFLNILFFSSEVFDVRFISGVYYVALLGSVYAIAAQLKTGKLYDILLIIFLIFVTCDAAYIAYFNSFYSEPFSFVLIFIVLALAIRIIRSDRPRIITFLFLAVTVVLFLTSKPQYIISSVFFAAAFIIITLIRKNGYLKSVVVISAAVVAVSIYYYSTTPQGISDQTLYNSVFYGVMKDSDTVSEDLEFFGLDDEFAECVGTQYYWKPVADEELTTFYEQVSKTDVIKFYLMHPVRFLEKLEITASLAFDNQGGDELGNFEEEYSENGLTKNYFFTVYSTVKSSLPHTLFFVIPFYIVYFILLILLYRRGAKKTKTMAIAMFAIAMIGLTQFPMPILANGEADIGKQLFLFNVTFDLSLFLFIATAIDTVKHFRHGKTVVEENE